MSRENVYWIRDKLKGCIENGWKEERKSALENKSYCANWDDSKWSGDRTYKSVFVHVPRTGGTSIGSAIHDYSVKTDHHLAKDIKLKHLYKNFFFYTILRNPYERMVSIYEYIFREWGYIRKLLAFYQLAQQTEDISKLFFQLSLPQKQMKNLITQLPTPTRENFSFERFVNIATEELWDILWEPQTSFIFDDNDKLIVNYVGRTETLQKDLECIVQEIEKISEMKISISSLQQNNKTEKSRVSLLDYFRDESTKEKMEKYYEKDIEYLKVKF